MAKIEDLIKGIPDVKLRDEIAREVTKLKSEKKFGLVFEEHLPEQVLLPGLLIKPGARVVKRGADTEIFTVIREVVIEYGVWKEESSKVQKVRVTPENIEDLFLECSRKIKMHGSGLNTPQVNGSMNSLKNTPIK